MSDIAAPRRRLRSWTFAAMAVLFSASPALGDVEVPEVYLESPARLARLRSEIQDGRAEHQAWVAVLREEADRALEEGPFSVLDKDETPPSGDKRDYMSQGPYWWPDPDEEDGLPYLRRDGDVNPESRSLDKVRKGRLTRAVQRLALAYYFLGEARYAEHAAKLLDVWFLDDETGMNPNLEYAQRIPGRTDGRGIGVIDTVAFAVMLDAVEMLEGSAAWTESRDRALRAWFGDYLDWLWTSANGRNERGQPNNHGTWYDVQVVRFALFAGREGLAREVLRESVPRRLANQIDADGRQPYELRRTKGWSYSQYNLRAFFDLAQMASRLDIENDLWHHETDDGASLRKGIDFLADYMDAHAETGASDWEYDAEGMETDITRPLGVYMLLQAADVYDAPRYRRLAEQLQKEAPLDAWTRYRQPIP